MHSDFCDERNCPRCNPNHSYWSKPKNMTILKEQPDPIPNESTPIVDLVIKDMEDRKRVGIERYGVALQAHNGRDALRDTYEELLDACIYIKQVMIERDNSK